MTTICANRTEIAADTLVVGATKTSGRKIWRIGGWGVGGAGGYSEIYKILAEFKAHPEMTPKEVLENVSISGIKDVDMILLSPTGKLFMSENGGDPIPVLDPYVSIGTGAQGATVAMRLGLSPREAVKEMTAVDLCTGGKIHTYKIA